MPRSIRVYVGLAILIALATLFLISVVRNAGGSPRTATRTASEGHRLAEAWCTPCHAVEPHMAGMFNQAPSFEAIANRRGTTALSLKVFLRTSHQNMPDLVIAPDQADALANYIMTLKTN